MSDETMATAQTQKQYLLVVDDINMAYIGKIMPGIKYIEIEGMHVPGNDKHQFLVNPIAQLEQVPAPAPEQAVEGFIEPPTESPVTQSVEEAIEPPVEGAIEPPVEGAIVQPEQGSEVQQ